MRNNSKLNITIITLGTILVLSIITNFNIIDNREGNEGTIENRDGANLKNPKKSGYWILQFIHIDGNWSATANYDWCNGDGSSGNPYTIENVLIDASGSPTGSGIYIENSKNDYFIIRNCTVYNSGSETEDAGIKLENTNNGTLIRNNCSDNGRSGIILFNQCENNTILGNLIKDNQIYGIYIFSSDCQNNLIHKNSLIGTIGWYAHDDGMNNYWSVSGIGNYWDNWTTPDVEPDGIVDFPYTYIAGSAGSVDNFPLTEIPFHLGEKIHIDDSGMSAWTWSKTARFKAWCTGSGTYPDPYDIDGLEIDAGGSGSCILIENSNIYFIIRNSKVYNSGLGSYPNYDAGIKLYNTNNGTLTNNKCSNNSYSGIYLYSDCDNNTISGNTVNDNEYGIYVLTNCDNNTIIENYLYFNTNTAITIEDVACNDNRIKRNILLSKELEFIFNSGTRTIISLNYFGSNPPSFIVDVIAQSFSDTEFIITFNSSSETSFGSWEQSIQIWWNGIIIPSNNIKKLGNGLYNVSLPPIFITSGEDPILLNMTITAAHHSDKYFETYLAIEPYDFGDYILELDITDQSFSTKEFNITCYIYNIIGNGIDFASIQMWWDGNEVTNDVQNLGNGLYFVSLEPITVAPGEDPILLNISISADGYEDKYFETYLAVDPDVIDKTIPKKKEPAIPGYSIILIISLISIISVVLIRKRFLK